MESDGIKATNCLLEGFEDDNDYEDVDEDDDGDDENELLKEYIKSNQDKLQYYLYKQQLAAKTTGDDENEDGHDDDDQVDSFKMAPSLTNNHGDGGTNDDSVDVVSLINEFRQLQAMRRNCADMVSDISQQERDLNNGHEATGEDGYEDDEDNDGDDEDDLQQQQVHFDPAYLKELKIKQRLFQNRSKTERESI